MQDGETIDQHQRDTALSMLSQLQLDLDSTLDRAAESAPESGGSQTTDVR